eukprot:TRINITY_DN41880_c0_g1_i1.p2 TRINITY_DN41880_c0_g1~~TRINITY_DN41880_c0_g1_i1.p2  ORF type:complete len:325 (+),score=107.08 TRINITY_DN41880_c0_g1_i1:54-1028(+)
MYPSNLWKQRGPARRMQYPHRLYRGGIELLAIDVDGTLVDHSDGGRVPARSLAAVARAQALLERGVDGPRVVAATGRMRGVAQELLCRTDAAVAEQVTAAGVYMNGAVVHVGRGRVAEARLPGDVATMLLHILKGMDLSVSAIVEESLWAGDWDRWCDRLVEDGDGFAGTLGFDGLVEKCRSGAHVVSCCCDPAVAEETAWRIRAALRSRCSPATCPHVYLSTSWLIDTVAPGTSKAHGLRKLCRGMGVPRVAVASFGDGNNDVPMLRWAGLSIAMGNGSAACRRAAQRIVPRIDDAAEPGLRAAINLALSTRYVIPVPAGSQT